VQPARALLGFSGVALSIEVELNAFQEVLERLPVVRVPNESVVEWFDIAGRLSRYGSARQPPAPSDRGIASTSARTATPGDLAGRRNEKPGPGHRDGARAVEGLLEAQVAGDVTMPLTREFKETVQARIRQDRK